VGLGVSGYLKTGVATRTQPHTCARAGKSRGRSARAKRSTSSLPPISPRTSGSFCKYDVGGWVGMLLGGDMGGVLCGGFRV